MRYCLLPLIFFISFFPVLSQTLYTFSNTAATNIASGATSAFTIPVSGVPTSGNVLRQVNISFGNTATTNSGNVNAVTMKLKDVAGTERTLLSSASFDGATGDFRQFNIKLRDHAALNTPKQQKDYTGSTLQKGYPFSYGYYRPQDSFTFNTTSSVNGNWTFTVTNSSAGARTFVKIELIFGPAISVTDIRATPPNQTCATRVCLQTGSVYWAKNDGSGFNQATAPDNTVGGCAWNNTKDNMIWFYFVASASSAVVSISGLETVQQSIVLKSTTGCSGYTLAAGGCYTEMFSGSVDAKKYYQGTWASGYAWNHEYTLTGLISGHHYLFVIDGSGGTNSDYYVELLSGASNGCSPLPIELLDFAARPIGNEISLNWATATERENDYFTISRSADMVHWEEVAKVPGSGNTNSRMEYAFTDTDPLQGISYYQLKQTDYNGQFEEFDPVSVQVNKRHGNAVLIYPNPAQQDFEVRIHAKGCDDAVMDIYDVSGKSVLRKEVKLYPGPDKIKIAGSDLQKGIYVVSVRLSNGEICSEKLVIE